MKIEKTQVKLVVASVLHSEAHVGEKFRPTYVPYLCLNCKLVFKSRLNDGKVDKLCQYCSQEMEELSAASVYCSACKAYSAPSRYLQFECGQGPYPLMQTTYNVEGCASCLKIWLDNTPFD